MIGIRPGCPYGLDFLYLKSGLNILLSKDSEIFFLSIDRKILTHLQNCVNYKYKEINLTILLALSAESLRNAYRFHCIFCVEICADTGGILGGKYGTTHHDFTIRTFFAQE